MSGGVSRATALAAGFLAVLAIGSCNDEPVGTPRGGGMLLVLQPSAALLGSNDQACAKTNAASVKLTGGSLVTIDTTLAITGCDGPITLAVPLTTPTGNFALALDEFRGVDRLFTASGSVTLTRGARSQVTLTLQPVVAGLTVPDTLPLLTAIGDSVVPLARAVFGTGDTISTASPATWTADGSGVVRVSTGGAIVALKEGQATLTASLQGFTATTRVRVKAAVSSLAVTPDSVALLIGGGATLTAVARDRNGNALQRTPTWQSSAAGVATVDAAGVVTGVAPGQAVVTATVEGRSANSRVFVLQPLVAVSPTQLNFSTYQGGPNPADQTVAVTNGGFGPLTGLSASVAYGAGATGWLTATLGSTTAPASLTVHANAGSLSAGTYQATITVNSTVAGAGTGRVNVQLTVGPPPVATVTVSPSAATVVKGQTTQLSATLKDAAGNTLTGRTIAWTSSNTQVATVSSTGLVTGVAVGTATITATSEGKSGTSAITVVQPSLTATPDSLTFSAYYLGASPASQQVSVTNAGGGTLSGLSATIAYADTTTGWLSATLNSTTAPATLTVSATTGLLPIGTYQAVITLSSTVSGSGTAQVAVTFTVAAAPVARVTVTPSSATLALNGSIQLTATTYDAAGNVLTGRTVTWTTTDPKIAYPTPTRPGYVINQGASGTATVTATSEGKSGTSTIGVPRIAASPTSLSTSAYPWSATSSITNAGGGTLSGITVQSVTYSGPVGTAFPTDWLNASVDQSTPSATLTVQLNQSIFGWGPLTATVRVTSSNGGSVDIVVTYDTGIIG